MICSGLALSSLLFLLSTMLLQQHLLSSAGFSAIGTLMFLSLQQIDKDVASPGLKGQPEGYRWHRPFNRGVQVSDGAQLTSGTYYILSV